MKTLNFQWFYGKINAYFIGLPGYRDAVPYDPSLLVYFRKRPTAEILADIYDVIIKNAKSKSKRKGPGWPSGKGSGGKPESPKERPENKGAMIIDAKLDISMEDGFSRIEAISF